MNVSIDMHVLGEWWFSLLIGAAVMVGLAALVARRMQRATWQRTVWQICVLSLVALLIGEWTGVSRGVTQWTRVQALSQITAVRTRLAPPDEKAEAGYEEVNAFEFAIPVGTIANEPPSIINADEQQPSPGVFGWGELGIWIGMVWLLGSVVIFARILLGQCALVVFRFRHQLVRDEALQNGLQSLAARLGLGRVRVVSANGLSAPIAFGWVWPTIGLPRRFADQFSLEKREAMLAHELAHLAAWDPAWHLLGDLVTAVLWWHPMVWWARHELRMASEFAADEASVVVRDGPGSLADCLVELGRKLTTPALPDWVGVEGRSLRSGLARRVTRLLALAGEKWQPPARGSSVFAKSFGPTAMVAVALLSTAWLRPLIDEKGDSMSHILRQSWRQSLMAAALVSFLGSAQPSAMADDPDSDQEKEAFKVKEVEGQLFAVKVARDDTDEKEAKEGEERKAQIAEMKQKIDALRDAGRKEEAEKLVRYLEEVQAKVAQEGEEKDPKPSKVYSRKVDAEKNELIARLKALEAENAKLRQIVEKVQTKETAKVAVSGKEPVKYPVKEYLKYLGPELVKEQFTNKEITSEAIEEMEQMIAKLKQSGQKEEAEKVAQKLQAIREAQKAYGYRAQFLKPEQPKDASLEKVATAISQLQEQLNGLRKEVEELRRVAKEQGDRPEKEAK